MGLEIEVVRPEVTSSVTVQVWRSSFPSMPPTHGMTQLFASLRLTLNGPGSTRGFSELVDFEFYSTHTAYIQLLPVGVEDTFV